LWVGGSQPLEATRTVAGNQIVRLPDFHALERQLVRIGARY
jgi:hypothetical protein